MEEVIVNTNINLGPESSEPPSPTYTLTVPTTPGFPEAGKFYTFYYLDEGWYMSDATNITYYNDGLFMWWVANVKRAHLKELRDYYATFMVHNGLIREEVDLLRGRVGKSIFMQHYFSPNIEDLKARVLAATDKTQQNCTRA